MPFYFPRIQYGSGVFILFALTLFLFLVQMFVAGLGYRPIALFALVPGLVTATPHLYWYQFLTANFLHVDFFHLFFNLFSLYIFGPTLESRFGRGAFLRFYLACGLGGYLLHFLLNRHSLVPVLGASGCDFGLLFAFCWFQPRDWILLFFILPVQAWQAGILFGLLELAGTFQSIPDGVAHLVHLGGMGTAFLMLRFDPREKWEEFRTWLRQSRRDRKKSRFRIIRPGERPTDED